MNIEDIILNHKKIAVCCKTKNEASELINFVYMSHSGFDRSYCENKINLFSSYKNDTCYDFRKIKFYHCHTNFYKSKGFSIIEFKDIDFNKKEIKEKTDNSKKRKVKILNKKVEINIVKMYEEKNEN